MRGMTFDPRPPLRVCEACARHVFATETSCPFCAAVLAPVPNRPRFKLTAQLSRAQRFALAGAVAGLIACSEQEPKTNTIAIYGAPVPPVEGGGGYGGDGAGGRGSGGAGGVGGSGGSFGAGCGGRPFGNFSGGDAGWDGSPWRQVDEDGGNPSDDGGSDEDAGHQ
jgi:hypothetical protein